MIMGESVLVFQGFFVTLGTVYQDNQGLNGVDFDLSVPEHVSGDELMHAVRHLDKLRSAREENERWWNYRWWFSNIFGIFTPKIGEDSHFDEHIFQMGGSTTN